MAAPALQRERPEPLAGVGGPPQGVSPTGAAWHRPGRAGALEKGPGRWRWKVCSQVMSGLHTRAQGSLTESPPYQVAPPLFRGQRPADRAGLLPGPCAGGVGAMGEQTPEGPAPTPWLGGRGALPHTVTEGPSSQHGWALLPPSDIPAPGTGPGTPPSLSHSFLKCQR